MSASAPRPDWTLRAHAALAAVAVALSALAWAQPDWLRVPGDVSVLPATHGALVQVRWQAGEHVLRLSRDGERLQLWRRARTDAEDAETACPANPAAEAAWVRLGRLRAARSLGHLGEAQRQAAQLVVPLATLDLTFGDKSARLSVGGTPFGREERFVENARGDAFLLPAGMLALLWGDGEALCAAADDAAAGAALWR